MTASTSQAPIVQYCFVSVFIVLPFQKVVKVKGESMTAPSNEVLNVKVEQHEARLKKIDEILDKVRNRPPVWVTAIVAILLGIIGWLAKGA